MAGRGAATGLRAARLPRTSVSRVSGASFPYRAHQRVMIVVLPLPQIGAGR